MREKAPKRGYLLHAIRNPQRADRQHLVGGLIVILAAVLGAIVISVTVTTSSRATRALERLTHSSQSTSWPVAWSKSEALGPSSPLRVALYGDSLAFQAQDFFEQALAESGAVTVSAHTFGGTAICDWLPTMPSDAATFRPQAVVLEFSGNALTPCMRDGTGQPLSGAAKLDKYTSDANIAIRILTATGAHVYLAGYPISRAAAEGLAPGWNQLNGLYAQMARSTPGTGFVDAGSAVEDHGHYTDSLPCLAGELCIGTLDGAGPANIVRSPDGVHFCPGGSGSVNPATGVCAMWSSGAYRYGLALAGPVIHDFLDSPAERPV